MKTKTVGINICFKSKELAKEQNLSLLEIFTYLLNTVVDYYD